MALANLDYIGKYRLLKMIRPARACEVWEAKSPSGGRRVALKVLKPNYRKDREQLTLMRHEYTVGQHLDHPNLIHMHEFGVDQSIPYLVMELYTTRNMKQAIQEGVDRLAYLTPRIVEEAAKGLEYFHRKGWIHRDVKPDNFLVDGEGHVKLIDLAIAQKQKGFGRWFRSRGKIQGTRSYMAPEQIRNEALDLRADVYGFGCTLYELFSGKPPYQARNLDDLLNKHLKSATPSLLAVNDNLTPEFAALVVKMMAKNRDERLASVGHFLKELSGMRVFWNRPRPPGPSGEQTNAESDA